MARAYILVVSFSFAILLSTYKADATSDMHCYSCGWVDGADEGDCVLGIDLEDTSINCSEEGWGEGCITRVVLDRDGNETWFRSCVGLHMKCISGYNDYGDYGQLWTSCCYEDNCNDHNPKEDITEEPPTSVASSTPSGLTCYYCGWEDIEDGGDCVLGNNLEETSIDCLSNGWGSGCISRTYRQPDGKEQLFRSCIGTYMSCESGYANYDEYGELWTSCCYEDDCNDDDPKEIEEPSLQCYFCGWEDVADGGDCVTGTNLEEYSVDCKSEGWGNGCISRTFSDADGNEEVFRSCIGLYMTCEEGYGNYGEYGELWTSCCNEDNCNDDDPKDVEPTPSPSSLQCYSCGWDFESDGGDCVSGDNLEGTSINCEAEGWGEGCITRVFRESDGEVQYFRSCIGKYMTCVDGYGNYGEYGELWTSCCNEDNCNDDDPKDVEPTPSPSSLQCYSCGWDFESDGGDCVSGDNLEGTSINCEAEGWGEGCITRVFRESDGEVQYFRSCIGKYMTCVDGYGNYGDYGELWTSCCDEDNCNDNDPKEEMTTTISTTASTTKSSTTARVTTEPTTMSSNPAVTTDPNNATGLQMSILIITTMFLTVLTFF